MNKNLGTRGYEVFNKLSKERDQIHDNQLLPLIKEAMLKFPDNKNLEILLERVEGFKELQALKKEEDQ